MSSAYKTPCLIATTANINLAGGQTISDIDLEDGDLVLVRAQTDPVNNGIYVVRAGDWDRSSQLSDSNDVRFGAYVPVRGNGVDSPVSWYGLREIGEIVIGLTPLHFDLLNESTGGGGGGGGAFDPSSAPAFLRVAYVGSTSPFVDDVNETGGPIAPFSTIAEALAKFAGYTGGVVTILVDDAAYSESLAFDVQNKTIVIRALSCRGLRLTGSHSVTVANSGYGLFVEGVGDNSNANTFTVFDGGVAASSNPALLTFSRCSNFNVARNGGASSVFNVEAVDECDMRAAGSISGVSTYVRLRNVRAFLGGFTVAFESAGTLDMDSGSSELWFAGVAKTLTNGARYAVGRFTYDGPDANGNVYHAVLNIDTRRLATVGVQAQRSPVAWWSARGWDVDSSVSRLAAMGYQCRPIPGNTVSAVLAMVFQLDSTESDTGLSFTSTGKIYFGGLTPTASLDGSINLPYSGGIVAQRDSAVSANADTVFTVGTVAGDPNWLSLGSANVKVRLANVVAIARATTSPTVAPSVGSLHWVDSATDNLESWSIGDTIFRYGAYVARFRSTSGIWTNLGANEIEVRVASSGSATSGYSTRVTGQFLTGSAADSIAGPGEARGGDNQGTGAAFVFKGGTGIVRGGDATGTGGGGTYVGGDAWLKPGTGATRTGNTMLGLSDPTSFNWQGMQRGFCVDMVAAKPTANPPSQKVWMYVDPNDLRLRVQDESGDLSMTTPIGTPLADANATLVVSTAAIRHMPAATMTATRTLVLDDLDAVTGELFEIYRFDETATRDLIVQNHDTTPIHTIPPGRWKAVFQFGGTNWTLFSLLRLP